MSLCTPSKLTSNLSILMMLLPILREFKATVNFVDSNISIDVHSAEVCWRNGSLIGPKPYRDTLMAASTAHVRRKCHKEHWLATVCSLRQNTLTDMRHISDFIFEPFDLVLRYFYQVLNYFIRFRDYFASRKTYSLIWEIFRIIFFDYLTEFWNILLSSELFY